MNQDCGRVELFGIKGNPAVGTDIIDIRYQYICVFVYAYA